MRLPMKLSLVLPLGVVVVASAGNSNSKQPERSSDATRTSYEAYNPTICIQAGSIRLHHLVSGSATLRGTQLEGAGKTTTGLKYNWSSDGEYHVEISGEYTHSVLGLVVAAGELTSRLSYQQPADSLCSPCSREPVREDSTVYNRVYHLRIQPDDPVLIVRMPMPHYPASLRGTGLRGTVEVQFLVDTTGHALACSWQVLQSTNHEFEAPALDAVMHALFKPGKTKGKPVRSIVEQRFVFAEH